MTALYKQLVVKFHPDRCREHYALERTKQINANKDNETKLRQLAIKWGVIVPTAADIRAARFQAEFEQRVRQTAAEARFAEAIRNQEAMRRAWREQAQAARNRRGPSDKLRKEQNITNGFTRCNLRPKTAYYGLGIKVYADGRGYITVDRTANEFVFYTDLRGKECRVSITKCKLGAGR